jgi:hypothetical protein
MDGLGFELGLLQKGIKARRLFVTFTKGAKSLEDLRHHVERRITKASWAILSLESVA